MDKVTPEPINNNDNENDAKINAIIEQIRIIDSAKEEEEERKKTISKKNNIDFDILSTHIEKRYFQLIPDVPSWESSTFLVTSYVAYGVMAGLIYGVYQRSKDITKRSVDMESFTTKKKLSDVSLRRTNFSIAPTHNVRLRFDSNMISSIRRHTMNFTAFLTLYGTVEQGMALYREKNDMWNSSVAGFITGGTMGSLRGKAQGVVSAIFVGGVAFSFSFFHYNYRRILRQKQEKKAMRL